MFNNTKLWNGAVDREVILQQRLSPMGLFSSNASKATITIEHGEMKSNIVTVIGRTPEYTSRNHSIEPYRAGLQFFGDNTNLQSALYSLTSMKVKVENTHSAIGESGSIFYYRPLCLHFIFKKDPLRFLRNCEVETTLSRMCEEYNSHWSD